MYMNTEKEVTNFLLLFSFRGKKKTVDGVALERGYKLITV